MPFLQFLTGEDEPIRDVKLGIHGFVEYIPGNTNLIISVPHGGEMRPPFMDDRDKKPKTTKSTVVPPPGLDKDNKDTNVGDDESKVWSSIGVVTTIWHSPAQPPAIISR